MKPKKLKKDGSISKQGEGGGRPAIDFDYEQAYKYSQLGCTINEISNVMNVSDSFLQHDEKFLRSHKKGLDSTRMSLRRAQLHKAIDGKDRGMQIWLGKQLLEQKDKQDVEHSGITIQAVNFTREDCSD